MYGIQKKVGIKKLISNVSKKSNITANSIFNLNIQRILIRIFPFISRKLSKIIIKAGLVRVNSNIYFNNHIKVGDFIRILFCKIFLKKYKYIIKSQKYYIRRIGKHLYRFYKSQRQILHLRRKNYLSMYSKYTRTYKKIPTWLEVSFLTMSIFVIKRPKKLSFNTVNYNHYISKLLFFK